MVLAITIAGFGIIYFSGTIGVEECKVAVKEARQAEIQRKVERRRGQEMFKLTVEQHGKQPEVKEEVEQPKVKAKGVEGYQGIFAPQNLQEQAGGEQQESEPKENSGSQGLFSPENLQNQVDSNTGNY